MNSKWAQHRMQTMCVFSESVLLLLLKMAKMNSFTKKVKWGESHFTPTLLPWRGCFCDKIPEVPCTQEAISSAVDSSWCCLTGWSLQPRRNKKQNAGSSSTEGAVRTHTGFVGHSFFRLRELWGLLHFFTFIFYIHFCSCVCLCTTCVHDATGDQNMALDLPGIGVTGCKPPWWCWDWTLVQLPVFLTADPLFRLWLASLWKWLCRFWHVFCIWTYFCVFEFLASFSVLCVPPLLSWQFSFKKPGLRSAIGLETKGFI